MKMGAGLSPAELASPTRSWDQIREDQPSEVSGAILTCHFLLVKVEVGQPTAGPKAAGRTNVPVV